MTRSVAGARRGPHLALGNAEQSQGQRELLVPADACQKTVLNSSTSALASPQADDADRAPLHFVQPNRPWSNR